MIMVSYICVQFCVVPFSAVTLHTVGWQQEGYHTFGL